MGNNTTRTLGITGATGLIGRQLKKQAQAAGWSVIEYSRNPSGSQRSFSADVPLDLSGLDVIVNLAGESIMGLGTPSKKQRILQSRVQSTRRVVDALLASPNPPRVLVNASAIGFYGEPGDREVDEASPAGSGFLADGTTAWEAETQRAEAAGIRVALIRIGMVLAREGGAAKLMRPAFKLGLGGKLGSGRQWMSAIHVADVAGIILAAASDANYRGPFNAVLPEPVTNAEFTRLAGQAAHRPAILPAPEFAIRLALGELSGLLLGSLRVKPQKTLEQGYSYQFPTLSGALTDVFH